MNKLTLLPLLVLILIGCGIERYDDGSKLFKFYYINGTLKKTQLQKPNEGTGNGYWKYYDEDGDIVKEYQITEGKGYGVVKFYWKNGNIKVQEFLKEGISSGNYSSYYENGLKEYQGQKVNGQFVGTWWYFDINGDTVKEIVFEEGELLDERSYK